MYQFQCDYSEGAHPRIMARMMETNLEQTVGWMSIVKRLVW